MTRTSWFAAAPDAPPGSTNFHRTSATRVHALIMRIHGAKPVQHRFRTLHFVPFMMIKLPFIVIITVVDKSVPSPPRQVTR
jgi:hypothetical protein